jgi:peptide/nickel transport system permease protein
MTVNTSDVSGSVTQDSGAPAGVAAGARRAALVSGLHGWLGGSVMMWVASGWLFLMLIAAVFADLLPVPSYATPVGDARISPFHHFSASLILGTDSFGRSMLSRAIYGARTDLLVSLLACAIGVALGGLLGLVAGYLRGWADRVLSFVVDSALALPPLVFLLTITTVLQPKLSTLVLGLAVLTVPAFARLERGAALAWAERPFVLAARSYGASRTRVAFRQVLPNSFLTIITFAPTVMAGLIVAEGSLGFLGLGLPPPTSSWGTMIADGRDQLRTAPHEVLVPSVFVFLTVMAFNVLGEGVRGRLESRSREA